MSKRAKILWIAIPVGVLVILFLGALVVLPPIVDAATKAAVEKVLPRITGTAVTLDRVDISIFSGRGELRGFIIRNPEGYGTPEAFRLGIIRVDVDLMSLMSDTIVIEELYIDGPEITFEQALDGGNNIGRIQDNVAAFRGPKKEGAEEPAGARKSSKKIQINRLVIRNGRVNVSATVFGGQVIPVPLLPIEMKDIGRKSGGTSIGEAAGEIFTAVTSSVQEVALYAIQHPEEAIANAGKALGEGAEAAAEAAVKVGGEVVEGAGKAAKDVVEGVGEAGEKAIEDVGDKLKDLSPF